MVEVFSSGGGTQSTCIAALIIMGLLPKPDLMIIADTEYECGTTWSYLHNIVAPELKQVGVEVHIVSGADWKNKTPHGHDYISHNMNTLLVPAFTDESGQIGKLPGFCSKTWKVEVINRFLSKSFALTRAKYRKWIGFSRDEVRRIMRMMNGDDWQRGLIRFPLVHDVPLRRSEVIRVVEKMGWPTPPRSRCWMCPNQADDEWQELKEKAPEEFKQAVEFERQVQAFDPCAWLHRSCKPLDTVDFTAEPSLFDAGDYCSSGVCFI